MAWLDRLKGHRHYVLTFLLTVPIALRAAIDIDYARFFVEHFLEFAAGCALIIAAAKIGARFEMNSPLVSIKADANADAQPSV